MTEILATNTFAKQKAILIQNNSLDEAFFYELASCLGKGDTNAFRIKKLKGRNQEYSVRKGSYRVIYQFREDRITFLSVSHRSCAYKD